ncbi:MAG: DUF4347 domain-containing protein, partial [Saprospiraceae bacterium]
MVQKTNKTVLSKKIFGKSSRVLGLFPILFLKSLKSNVVVLPNGQFSEQSTTLTKKSIFNFLNMEWNSNLKFLRIPLAVLIMFNVNSSGVFAETRNEVNQLILKNLWIDHSVSDKETITKAFVQTKQNESVLQLFTHGRPGELLIEGEWRNAIQIAQFLNHKFINSDCKIQSVNIYACNFARGQIGENAIAYLQNTLHINFAASNDLTGHSGDWNLEVGKPIGAISLPNYNEDLQYGISSCMGAQTVTMAFTGTPTITGTANTVGSTYRYSNVLQGSGITQQVDAVFTLNSLNFGSSTIQSNVNFNYDVPGATIGFDNNFQPSFVANNGSTMSPYPALGTYVLSNQWTVNFYLAGTTTPVNLPIVVEVFDNDGASSYNINEITTFNTTPNSIVTSAAGATPTTETISGGNTATSNNTGISGITNALQYMVYANYASVSSFQFTFKDSIQISATGFSFGSRFHSMIIGCQNPGATNFPCAAGTTAPAITATTLSNNCPSTTVDLTALANTGTVPNGATLIWSTHNPPTSANDTLTTAQASAVSTSGKYYALYRSTSTGCYSPADSVMVTIVPCCDAYTTGTQICDAITAGNTALGTLDCDGDGQTNATECTNGTDPTDECSNTYTSAQICAYVTSNPTSP